MVKNNQPTAPADSVLRALTDDGSFRVITARTTDTIRGAVEAQHAHGTTAQRFGDLLTGTILLRETMSPQLRVQGIARGTNACGSLVADSHPGGASRGLVQIASGHSEVEIAGGFLQMMRTLHNGRLQQGIVEIPEQGGISAGLMRYMQISEQVTSVIAVATITHEDRVVGAGGYIVQLLPEAREGTLAVMTERLADFASIEELVRAPEFTPTGLTEELLYRMPFAITEQSGLRFECNCSQVRVIAGLSTLNADEIHSLVEEGRMLEIMCDFCGRNYQISPEQLRGLLKSN
jgi:molecular chaperone Hsp33